MAIQMHWLVKPGRNPVCARVLFCALAVLMVGGVAARGQAPTVPGKQVFYSTIGPLEQTVGRYQTDPRPQSAEGAFPILDWLLYGGLGFGVACDYNLASSPTNPQRACGPQVTPTVIAARNTGIQRTILYGVGDIRYYPTLGHDQIQLVNTTAGIAHVWEIQRDLIFRVQAQGTFSQDYSGLAANLLPTNAFLTTPLQYAQGYASSSIQKEFGNFFTAIGGSFTRTVYRDLVDNFGNTIDEQFRNNSVSTLNTRFGYHISPIIYTFVEPTYNWTQYAASSLDSEGYRVVAGLGTGRIGLFNGEIYAGYAAQRFEDPTIGTVSIPVVGGRLSWFPTRFVTYTFTADRVFGTSDFINVTPGSTLNTAAGLLPGTTTITTTAALSGTWDFSRLLSFNASVANSHLEYLNSFRRDDLLSLGAGVTFKVRANLGISVNYTHQNLLTNFPGAAFTRDLISAGARSQF